MMTKPELLSILEKSREEFLDAIDIIPEELLDKPGVINNWSVRDLMVLLNHWEAELIKLLWQIKKQGQVRSFSLDDRFMSQRQSERWVLDSRSRVLEHILEDFQSIRNQTILRIEDLTNQELVLPVSGQKTKSKPLSDWIALLSYQKERDTLEAIRKWLEINQPAGSES
jgi:hypothetical protein